MESFSYLKNGVVTPNVKEVVETTKVLKRGFYNFVYKEGMFGNFMEIKQVDIQIPKSSLLLASKIIDIESIESFFGENMKQVFKGLGVKRKDGKLFHGIQGSGKTTTINAIAQILVNTLEARVFKVADAKAYMKLCDLMSEIRGESDFFCVIVWDECEGGMENYERQIKPYLDGSDSVDNCMTLCSTNYIELIPETIKDRPSRFSEVIEVSEIKFEDVVYEILNSFNESLSGMFEDKYIRKVTPRFCNKTIDQIKNDFFKICVNKFKK